MKFEKVRYPESTGFYAKMVEPPLKGEVPIITHWIDGYEDLFYLMKIKDICDHNGIDPILNIPCLIDAQADKRFNSNESADLKLTCNFINMLKFKKVRVFHPHNPEVVEMAINNCEIVSNYNFTRDVLENIFKENRMAGEDYSLEDNITLMSTDAGGFKPLMKLCDKFNWRGETYSASKSRQWNGEKSELIQRVDKTDFKGKDILIIDDLCVYGGTFVGLANLLMDRNCGKLYLATSHMTVSTPNKQLEQSFHKIFTTNSKYPKYNLKNIEVFDANQYF